MAAPNRSNSDPIHHQHKAPDMGVKSASTGTGSTRTDTAMSERESYDLTRELFVGPRNLERHSKLPFFMRLSGSITPRMIVPILFVGGWASAVTSISILVHTLEVNSTLLTVLGLVIGLAISFRTSTAYERYLEGRKYWALCMQASRDLARYIWIHAKERHTDENGAHSDIGKGDLLAKLTALNLIEAYAVALMHKLRFEPFAFYDDLKILIPHLDTFAHEACDENDPYDVKIAHPPEPTPWKKVGTYLGITFAQSNPRKVLKKTRKNLGNLPLEILLYLSAYLDSIIDNNTLPIPIQSQSMVSMAQLNDVLTGTERVLNTPLPVAYSIAISQITWVYVLALPFQLVGNFGWVAIPFTMLAAFVILGIAAIGTEIENPFGHDTNDLPLDDFCKQIKAELRIISSKPQYKPGDFIYKAENRPLGAMSHNAWESRSVEDIRASLRARSRRELDGDDTAAPEKQIGMV